MHGINSVIMTERNEIFSGPCLHPYNILLILGYKSAWGPNNVKTLKSGDMSPTPKSSPEVACKMLSPGTIVYKPHHLSECRIQPQNVSRRHGNAAAKTSPHVARVLLRPVVRHVAEQHVELCEVRVDECLVLDIS